jgi:hypothetical protein
MIHEVYNTHQSGHFQIWKSPVISVLGNDVIENNVTWEVNRELFAREIKKHDLILISYRLNFLLNTF